MYNVTLKRVRETIAAMKKIHIIYIFVCRRTRVRVCGWVPRRVCACVRARVALIIQHATSMRHIVREVRWGHGLDWSNPG
jgi:hypothetical protein